MEVWREGQHVLALGDFYAEYDTFRATLPGRIDTIWTDPPWSDGVLTRFFADSAVPQSCDLEQLLGRLGQLCAEVKPSFVLVKMGRPNLELLRRQMAVHGAMELDVVPWFDGSCFDWLGSWRPGAIELEAGTGSVSMQDVVRSGETFVDPFCGRGVFLFHALACGATVYGCEMNPHKFEDLKNGKLNLRKDG